MHVQRLTLVLALVLLGSCAFRYIPPYTGSYADREFLERIDGDMSQPRAVAMLGEPTSKFTRNQLETWRYDFEKNGDLFVFLRVDGGRRDGTVTIRFRDGIVDRVAIE